MIDETPLLWIYLGLIVAGQGLEILAEQLNAHRISRMRGRSPEALAGWIGAAELDRIERYSLDKMRFGRIRSAAGAAILVVLLLSGVLPWLADRIAGWGSISAGLVFFGAVGALLFAADLPFDYAAVFLIEQKHGFNTRTLHTWVADTVKGAVLSVFLSPAAAAVSRRFEREADRYALSLTGSSKGLCRALKKMARDNLTNLFPHPLYVVLHYSHPPIIERLDHLGCGLPEDTKIV